MRPGPRQGDDLDGTNLSAAERRSARRRRRASDVARARQFEWLARAGLAARGVIYAIIGVLAIKLALGDGGKTTNQQGALETIAQQPFGKALLVLMAIGLAGYALWRLVRAAIGHGPEASDDTKERIAGLASGIAYGALCVTAISILIGSGGGARAAPGQGDRRRARLAGRRGARGDRGPGHHRRRPRAGVQGNHAEVPRELQDRADERGVERAFTALGVFGHLARMVVFALIGYFLIRAAIDYDPDKAVSLDGALAAVGQASYGPTLLGVVAAGLIAFGAYSVADARYRKV